MKYDFTSILDRKGNDAMVVDALGMRDGFAPGRPEKGFDVIPMWVADMNFPVVPTIQQAVIERTQHPAFGYFLPRDEYYDEIIAWQSKRHGVTGLSKECIGYENGVLGGVVSALGVFCSKGDNVLLQGPTYIGFTHALGNNGYNIVHNQMKLDSKGIWRIDFEDMEKKIIDNKIHAAVFCSPHNPCGRVWERWELEKAMAIFEKHQVNIVSDEIWSDIILNGNTHIPTQMVSDYARNHTVALYAPSKTFNLAGLIGSYRIIYNPALRDRVAKESSLSHYNDMNVLSMHALIGAYRSEGYEWVDELCQVLSGNINWAFDYIKSHYEGIEVSKPQGTYMLFLDCSSWCRDHSKTIDELLKAGSDVGVAWQDGRPFGGEHTIRMNLALPLSRVQEAFARLSKHVFHVQ
ncbi:MAG: MalY/PatB family protein [Sphaerochaetaceae bacterium]